MVVPTLLTGQNDISQHIDKLIFRLSNKYPSGDKVIFYELLEELNIKAFADKIFTYPFIAYIVLFLCKIIRMIRKTKIKRVDIISIIYPYVIIASFPILWFALITNHSAIHAFFTYRELIISFFAIMICLIDLEQKLNTLNKEQH